MCPRVPCVSINMNSCGWQNTCVCQGIWEPLQSHFLWQFINLMYHVGLYSYQRWLFLQVNAFHTSFHSSHSHFWSKNGTNAPVCHLYVIMALSEMKVATFFSLKYFSIDMFQLNVSNGKITQYHMRQLMVKIVI